MVVEDGTLMGDRPKVRYIWWLGGGLQLEQEIGLYRFEWVKLGTRTNRFGMWDFHNYIPRPKNLFHSNCLIVFAVFSHSQSWMTSVGAANI